MKLSPWTFIISGALLAIIPVVYFLFQYYLPNVEQAKLYEEYEAALQVEANKMPAATERVENAKEEVMRVSDEWQEIVARRTPPSSVGAGGIDLSVNPYQLTIDARKFRNNVQRAVNAQVKRGGVLVIAGPYVSDPPEDPGQVLPTYFNYPTSPYPVAVFDLGTVTVRGTWNEIQQNVRGWASMPNYLAVTDGLAITGTSPELTATYNVTVVAFIRGKEITPGIQPNVPEGVTLAGAQQGGGPAFGGPPAGIGGGPAGMPGPPAGAPAGIAR